MRNILKNEKSFYIAVPLIVFIFYFHTLVYPWRNFDEQLIYNEAVIPILNNFSRIFTFIKTFGINNYFEASNTFYTSISNLRCDPVNNLITLFVQYLFKKDPFNYHLLSLILHAGNTYILFLLLNSFIEKYEIDKKKGLFISSSLTLMWALHPVNVESVVFATNWAALLTYFLYMVVFYLFLKNRNPLVLFIMFSITLFICEYAVTLPFILFSYVLYEDLKNKTNLNTSIKQALLKVSPLFISIILFCIYFILSPTKHNFSNNFQNYRLVIERVFWISPQIFIHYIKLLFFPLKLTIDQSGNVFFADSYFHIYAIFCILFSMCLIGFIVFSIFNRKDLFLNISLPLSTFIISLAPFLQTISPTYCLCSERYLYLPSLFFILGILHLILNLKKDKIVFSVMLTLLLVLSTRTYFRTLDWSNSQKLFYSAYISNSDVLLKALRLQFTGSLLLDDRSNINNQIRGLNLINSSIQLLSSYYSSLEGEKSKPIPEILKLYGLDPTTKQTKAGYLIAFSRMGLENDVRFAYRIISEHLDRNPIYDPTVVSFYTKLLKIGNMNDKAITFLEKAREKNISPLILIPLSELYILKNDFAHAEKYLTLAFDYFPYNIDVITHLRDFYFLKGDMKKYEHFVELYKLRSNGL